MYIFVYILVNNFAYLSMSIERLHTSYEYLLCLNSSHSGVMLCYLLQILFSSLFITYRWQILLNKQKMHPIRSVLNYFLVTFIQGNYLMQSGNRALEHALRVFHRLYSVPSAFPPDTPSTQARKSLKNIVSCLFYTFIAPVQWKHIGNSPRMTILLTAPLSVVSLYYYVL